MKNKRILSLVLAFAMLLGTFSFAFADEANIPEEIQWLIDEGYVLGDDGGYRLGDNITRAEVAVIVAKALGLEDAAKAAQPVKGQFKDVPAGRWDNGFINVLAGKGILNGYPDGTFKANNKISNAEVVTIMVMMIDGKVPEGGKYPFNMIARATELGLFNGTNIADYSKDATRQDTFMLIYNALMNLEIGNYSVVKGIVLENNRVEALGKDEIVVEVIKEVQRANYADASRYEKGDQIRLVVPADVADVEELLGKVADFTITAGNKVVREPKVDETYTYVQGTVYEATRNKINVGGREYTVELEERYKDRDERIFRTYHNDKDYKYEDFYKDVKAADYARVTVKNGKVLLIDAYTFEDIAPVQEVKRDGLDVYVYNDYRDARLEKFEPRALVLGFNNGKFSRIEREDIKANDVVHVYNRNRMIVRQDAKVTGVYDKVERDRYGNYFAHVDKEAYLINDTDYRRPVFAHDSKSYATLYARYAQNDLANFYKEEVVILVDINGDLQLFGANVEYNEGMAMIEQILARGQVKFVKPDNERVALDEDYSSYISTHNLGTGKTTTNQRLNAFNTRDLTFVLGAEDKIDTLVRIATEKEMREAKKELKSAKAADMNNSFIRMKDDFRYQVLDRTNVFVINKNGSISGTTVAKLQSGLKADSKVEAFILTDKDVSKLVNDEVIYDRNRITNKEDIAHTIVFLDVDYADPSWNRETVLVTNVFTARAPHYVVGQKADNEGKDRVERTAAAGVSLRTLNTNDIVSLRLSKDDDALVRGWDVLIPANKVETDSYRVVGGELEYSRYNHRRLVLEDANGVKVEEWLVKGVEEFGTITMDSVVTFHKDANGDIDVIRVYPKNTQVTAHRTEEATGLVTYINDAVGSESFAVDKKTPYFLNDKTILTDKDNNVLAMGAQAVIKKLVVGDQVEVTIKGDVMTIKRLNTKDELAAAPVIDKINALPEAKDITAENVEELAEEVEAARTAYNKLTDEQKKLVDTAKLEAAEARIAELTGPAKVLVKDFGETAIVPIPPTNQKVVLKLADLQTKFGADKVDASSTVEVKLANGTTLALTYNAEKGYFESGQLDTTEYPKADLEKAEVIVK